MRTGVLCGAIGWLCLGVASPALAQVHLGVDAGMARAAQDRPFVAGSLGLRLAWIEINAEVGRFKDLLPPGVLNQLNELQEPLNLPVRATASMPVTYALGQVRFISRSGPVRPFISGGVGMARVHPRVDIEIQGISLGDVFGLTSAEPSTDRMLTGGAGLRIPLAIAHVEAGYRYVRIYRTFTFDGSSSNDDLRTSAHTVYVGLGIRF
jgi:hypothetical protein